jgi:peptidoglycan/LPS O-acetylase OafA/YrhL
MTLTFLVTLAIGAPRFETSLGHWLANLVIFSPALRQPFMDGVYWSIVYELTFYAWAFGLILFGLFSRRLTLIIVIWLAISIVNELMIGSGVVRRLLITDDSGFFCAGLLLYVLYSGRGDRFTVPLLGLATFLAAGQSVLHADWVRHHYGVPFSDHVIAAISVGVVALVGLCLLPKRVPLPAKLIAAIGGLTYPLYLLHQQIGCIVFNRLEGSASNAMLVSAVIAAMLLVSFVVWRFAERPAQGYLKSTLTRLLAWPFGWSPSAVLPRRSRTASAGRESVPTLAVAPSAVFGPVVLPRAARS